MEDLPPCPKQLALGNEAGADRSYLPAGVPSLSANGSTYSVQGVEADEHWRRDRQRQLECALRSRRPRIPPGIMQMLVVLAT